MLSQNLLNFTAIRLPEGANRCLPAGGLRKTEMKTGISGCLCLFAAFFIALNVNASAPGEQEEVKEIGKYIDSQMKKEPFRSGLVGILAVTSSGDTLAEYSSLRKLLPASNTKLISTGLAIRALGPGFRFRTRIGCSGEIKDGTLHGDLCIIGGGDPTIASGDSIALSADSLFSVWASIVRKAGIRKIDGDVVGDGSFFDGMRENGSWSYGDIGTYYGAGGDGLCFYRNIQEYLVKPGASEGSRPEISVSHPSTPWLEFRNVSVTAPAGTGDNLYLYNTDLAPVAEMRGTYAVDKAPKKLQCSNKYGALTCAFQFRNFLEKAGIEVSGGAADCESVWSGDSLVRRHCDGRELEIIGETFSPSLKDIAFVTNRRSDNFYAETLLRTLSVRDTGSASYDSCMVTVREELDSLGVDWHYGVRMYDGSGLARHNYMSPDFFCRFLKAMSETEVFDDYMKTISHPGNPGMASRLAGQPASLKDRIWMKSGSMDGVLCYSGYIMPESGNRENLAVFSIMTNNCPDGGREVREFIDNLIALVAKAVR